MKLFFPEKGYLIFFLFSLLLFYAYVGIVIETMNWKQSITNLYMLPVYNDIIILLLVCLVSFIPIIFSRERKNIFKYILFFLLLSVCLITLKQAARFIEIVSFYKNPEEIKWALKFNFDDNYISKYEKVNGLFTKEYILKKESNNPNDQLYLSPSGEFRIQYLPDKEGSGFYIINYKTNAVLLKLRFWVINPTIIKWVFDEKYIVFEHKYSDEDMPKTQVININTGKSIFL